MQHVGLFLYYNKIMCCCVCANLWAFPPSCATVLLSFSLQCYSSRPDRATTMPSKVQGRRDKRKLKNRRKLLQFLNALFVPKHTMFSREIRCFHSETYNGITTVNIKGLNTVQDEVLSATFQIFHLWFFAKIHVAVASSLLENGFAPHYETTLIFYTLKRSKVLTRWSENTQQ